MVEQGMQSSPGGHRSRGRGGRRSAVVLATWAIAAIGALIGPSPTAAQCNITLTMVGTAVSGGHVVIKDGPGIGTYTEHCAVGTMMHSALCHANTYQLTARATVNQIGNSPSCSFVCDCGTVTITGADGLPVELMELTIEASEDQRAGDAEADGAGPR